MMGFVVFCILEDWGPYEHPTSSTCGGPAGDPFGPQFFLGMIGDPKNFWSKKIWVKKSLGKKFFRVKKNILPMKIVDLIKKVLTILTN